MWDELSTAPVHHNRISRQARVQHEAGKQEQLLKLQVRRSGRAAQSCLTKAARAGNLRQTAVTVSTEPRTGTELKEHIKPAL